ncbi:hypothetical protein FACS1894132_01440 [Clostridia bacterium]|nr:hypothetical protein FACS1894132_01440 [Clostridia bacterium]
MKEKIQIGSIVRATAGRDEGDWFVVVGIFDESFLVKEEITCLDLPKIQVFSDRYVLIANGKSRKLETPKKKNIKHLSYTNKKIEIKLLTNKSLKRIIKGFEVGCVQKEVILTENVDTLTEK